MTYKEFSNNQNGILNVLKLNDNNEEGKVKEALSKLSNSERQVAENAINAKMSADKFEASMTSLGKASKLAAVGMNILNTAITGLVIWGVTKLIEDIVTYSKKLAEAGQAAVNNFKESQDAVDEYKSKIESLYKVINDETSSQEQVIDAKHNLVDIQKELIATYGQEAESLNLVNASMLEQKEILKNLGDLKNSKKLKTKFELDQVSDYGFFDYVAGVVQVISDTFTPIRANDVVSGKSWENGLNSRNHNSVDKAKEEMENFSKTISKTENDELNKLIESYANITSKGNKFVISGNVNDIQETIIDIQSRFENSEGWTKNFESALDGIYKKAKNISDEFGSTYDQALYFEVMDDANASKYYSQIQDKYFNVQNAQSEEDKNQASKDYIDLINKILNDSSLSERFKDFIIKSVPGDGEIVKQQANKGINDYINNQLAKVSKSRNKIAKYENDKIENPTDAPYYNMEIQKEKSTIDSILNDSVIKFIGDLENGLYTIEDVMGNANFSEAIETMMGQFGVSESQLMDILESMGLLNNQDAIINAINSSVDDEKMGELMSNLIYGKIDGKSQIINSYQEVLDYLRSQEGFDPNNPVPLYTYFKNREDEEFRNKEAIGRMMFGEHYDSSTSYEYKSGIASDVNDNFSSDEINVLSGLYDDGTLIQGTIYSVEQLQDAIAATKNEAETTPTLADALTSGNEKISQFISSLDSMYSTYETLTDEQASAEDRLSAALSMNKAITEMGGTMDWEGAINGTIELDDVLEEMNDKFKEGIISQIEGYEDLDDETRKYIDTTLDAIAVEKKRAKETNTMNKRIDNIQSAYQDTMSIIDDYNKSGYISIDNAQKLLSMDTEYLACLEMKNGKLQVNEEMYRALMKVQLMKIKADLEEAASEEIIYKVKEIAAGRMTEDMAIKDAEINKNDQLTDSNVRVAVSEELAAAGLQDFANVANAVGDAVMAKFNGIYASIMEAMSALNFADAMAGGGGGAVGGGGGGGASASDPWKDEFDAQYKTLKHNLTMGYITQKQYYDQLKRLNEKYFAGRAEYLDEYRQYEEEIYTGMREWYKEQLEARLQIQAAHFEKQKVQYAKYITFVRDKIKDLSKDVSKLLTATLKGTFSKDMYLSTSTEIEKLKKKYTNDLKKLRAKYESGEITKEAYREQKQNLKDQYTKRYNKLLSKSDKATKYREKINARTEQYENAKAKLDAKKNSGKITSKEYDKQLEILKNDYVKEVEALEKKLTDYYKSQYKKQTIDYKEYIKERYKTVEKFYKKDMIDKATYLEQMKEIAEEEKEIYDMAITGAGLLIDERIKAINENIDKLNEENEALQKQKEKYDGALNAVNKYYDNKIDALDKANEKLQKELDLQEAIIAAVEQGIDDEIKINEEQIEAIEDKIDSLNKENEARQKQMDLSKAAYELEKAQSQKTAKILKDGQFVWAEDEDAIRKAQEEYDNAVLEKQIYDLEQEKEAIEETNEALEKLKEKWEDIATVYEKAANLQKLQDAYGKDALDKILNGDESIIKKVTDAYYKASEQMDINEKEKERWEELKEIWEEAQDKYTDATNDKYAEEIFGKDWQKQISDINTATKLYEEFRNAYAKNEKQTYDNEQKIEALEKEIDTLEKAKEKWESVAKIVEETAAKAAAKQLMQLNDEKDILEARIKAWDDFAERYLDIQAKIANYDEEIGKEKKDPTTNPGGDEPAPVDGGGGGGGGETPTSPGTGNKRWHAMMGTISYADFATQAEAEAWIESTATRHAEESEAGRYAKAQAEKEATAARDRIPESQQDARRQAYENVYRQTYDTLIKSALDNWRSKYHIERYAKGGLVRKNKNPFDVIAQSFGEDHMIAAKEGERILTPEQNKSFEKLVDLDPDKFKMLMSFSSMTNDIREIKLNTSHILSAMTQPNLQSVNNVSNTSAPVINITGTTFTCTGVTGEQVMRQIQDSFTGLVTNAYQQVNKR